MSYNLALLPLLEFQVDFQTISHRFVGYALMELGILRDLKIPWLSSSLLHCQPQFQKFELAPSGACLNSLSSMPNAKFIMELGNILYVSV